MSGGLSHPAAGPAVDASRSTQAPSVTVEDFDERVRKSGLVDAESLSALVQAFHQRTGGTAADGRAMAEFLVQGKVLSSWQAERLLDGRHDGFFLGRYKLLSQLGRGSMGVVYLAEHIRMRRRAALKLLPAKFVEDPQRLDLFYRESEATAALDHPNIVRAYDVDNEGETYYLVMEYVDGINFDQLIAHDGPLHYSAAAEYIRQAADGLAHAHERGIIHCDIKPANLMLDSSQRVKILDMGLSHWEEVEASPTLGRAVLRGTPSFIAPELIGGQGTVEVWSDIYSLGCTFYYLMTGRPPFTAGSVAEIIRKHVHEPPPRLTDALDEGPPEIEEIYQRMVAKRPEDRFSSIRDVCDALDHWQQNALGPGTADDDSPKGAQPGERREVLVAEDDEVTRQMLVMQLKKAGFHVRSASDGQEAMGIMDSQVTVCLFDLNMPRATGMDCLRYVHSRFPETPVIILTASGEIQDAIAAMRDGAFDYLTKPCRIANVLARIGEAIRARERRRLDGDSLSALIRTAGTESSTFMDTIIDHRSGWLAK